MTSAKAMWRAGCGTPALPRFSPSCSSFDVVLASGRLDAAQASAACRQLGACEASDAFWWLGSANDRAVVAEFDAMFRAQLARLYQLLDLPAPAALAQPMAGPGATPAAPRQGAGAMLPHLNDSTMR